MVEWQAHKADKSLKMVLKVTYAKFDITYKKFSQLREMDPPHTQPSHSPQIFLEYMDFVDLLALK